MTALPAAAQGVAPVFRDGLPMSYLRTFGPRADPVTALGWGLIAISLVVVVVIAVLVIVGALRQGRRPRGPLAELPAAPGPDGLRWIWTGLALTVIALFVTVVWTVAVMAQVNSPPTAPAFTIEVTGHQWWWEATYQGATPSETFTTANEIHIPVGRPVLVRLKTADVIHSFWIPALTGKTDTIPGRTNLTWLQADRPGIYRGQCTEYCGAQHAHMAMYVIADPPAAFEAWREDQMRPQPAPAAGPAAAGAQVFLDRCSACHTVRGTAAGGILGPDLTHLMSRRTLAAGALPNTVGALSGWIENPQALKPGTRMPATDTPPADLARLRAYLETLR